MKRIDLSNNARIPVLMNLVGSLSKGGEPAELQNIFIDGMQKAYGFRTHVAVTIGGLPPGHYRVIRVVSHEGRSAPGPVQEPSPEEIARLPIHNGGLIGELLGHGAPQLIHELDLPHDPVLGNFFLNYKSLVSAPQFRFGRVTEWIFLVDHAPNGLAEDDLERLIVRSNLVDAMIENARIAHELKKAAEMIQWEVNRIAAIQKALLPASLPQIHGLTLGASYQTFDRAGGDLYDLIPLAPQPCPDPNPRGGWAILIADASGHGPAAAVIMAIVHAILHAYPHKPAGPAEVLAHLNRHLCAKRIIGSFMTAFLGFYDPVTRVYTYANAGHPPALLKSPGGTVGELDEVDGFPLGIEFDAEYKEASVQLNPGQTVVLFTDGITEAVNPEGRMFGIAGLKHSIIRCSGEPDCVAENALKALRKHESGVRPRDDQTLLAFQVEAGDEVI